MRRARKGAAAVDASVARHILLITEVVLQAKALPVYAPLADLENSLGEVQPCLFAVIGR